MSSKISRALISPHSLHEILLPVLSARRTSTSSPKPHPTIFDCTFLLPSPTNTSTAAQLFQQQHIPTAKFFDIDECADKTTDLPHMFPSEELFSEYMTRKGVTNSRDEIVLYDQKGIFSSPRVWFLLTAFGHSPDKIRILNGGLPKWIQSNYPVEQGIEEDPVDDGSKMYPSHLNKHLLRNYQDISQIIDGKRNEVIIDARPKGRFTGKDPEPRQGLSSGHMPGSISIPYPEMLEEDGQILKDPEEIRKVFSSRGLEGSEKMVFSCGSGVSACVLARAADLLGYNYAVYDGSWSEYASQKDAKIEKSATL